MKLAVMQPYFAPYIGYFQLIKSADKFLIYDDVNFIKQGWINRNRILLNGESHYLTLNLKGASSFKRINEIELSGNFEKPLGQIKEAYKDAQYFKETNELLSEIFGFRSANLAGFVSNSIRKFCDYLDIRTELILSSDTEKDNTLKGEDKIIHICKLFNAGSYINAAGGKSLYNQDRFSSEGIDLRFIKTEFVEYGQFKNPFVPGLSIIDVLMFNNISDVKIMLDKYELE